MGARSAPAPAPPPAPPIDYAAIERQNAAQIAASNAQLALMQQQGVQQQQQFTQLLDLEKQRSAALEKAANEQATLFTNLQAEQTAAKELQQQRMGRAQIMAQQEQQGLFRLNERTQRTQQARSAIRRTQYGANANVFRR